MDENRHAREQPAELLHRARRAAGLSQLELAQRAGVSARAISALEQGVNRVPRRDTLAMLADALELPVEERRRWERLRRLQSRSPERAMATRARSTAASPPTNLPQQPTRFFGRRDEQTALMTLLQDDAARLVTLTGPGGSGKTRLALEVAAALVPHYPDGVIVVDMAPVTGEQQALQAMTMTLGLQSPLGQPHHSVLVEWLMDKRMLFVLDNLEHLLGIAPDIAALLERTQYLQILATSRAPLRLRVEREILVPPLPLPDVDTRSATGANDPPISEFDAVHLFIDRARAIDRDFTASDTEVEIVARICHQLDGLPLAIELAAASVRMFPPTTILRRLVHRHPLVERGFRDGPVRQRTMRDTIRWSYDLLAPDEQMLLR